MLNFSLRFLGQSTKFLFRAVMAFGGILLFSLIRLIFDYLLTGTSEEEGVESSIESTAEATRQREKRTSGTLPDNQFF